MTTTRSSRTTRSAIGGSTRRAARVTFDGDEVRRSVNGVLKTSTDADFLNSNGNAALRIRKGDDYGNNVIDDVAIYDAPLSAVQIAAHYLAGS